MATGKYESLSAVEDFLKQCEQSGDAAYAQARAFLSDLQKHFSTEEEFQECLEKFHFRIEDIILDQYEGAFHSIELFK